jgi:hypothetical protein
MASITTSTSRKEAPEHIEYTFANRHHRYRLNWTSTTASKSNSSSFPLLLDDPKQLVQVLEMHGVGPRSTAANDGDTILATPSLSSSYAIAPVPWNSTSATTTILLWIYDVPPSYHEPPLAFLSISLSPLPTASSSTVVERSASAGSPAGTVIGAEGRNLRVAAELPHHYHYHYPSSSSTTTTSSKTIQHTLLRR